MNPSGIIGSGYAKSSYYVDQHWDGTNGKTANYINIEFDVLIDPNKNILFGQELLDNVDKHNIQQWFPQQSGVSIKQDIVSSLENSWFNFINENKYIKNGAVLDNKVMLG